MKFVDDYDFLMKNLVQIDKYESYSPSIAFVQLVFCIEEHMYHSCFTLS